MWEWSNMQQFPRVEHWKSDKGPNCMRSARKGWLNDREPLSCPSLGLQHVWPSVHGSLIFWLCCVFLGRDYFGYLLDSFTTQVPIPRTIHCGYGFKSSIIRWVVLKRRLLRLVMEGKPMQQVVYSPKHILRLSSFLLGPFAEPVKLEGRSWGGVIQRMKLAVG